MYSASSWRCSCRRFWGATVGVFENSGESAGIASHGKKKERATALIAVPRMLDALAWRNRNARWMRAGMAAVGLTRPLKRAEGRPFFENARGFFGAFTGCSAGDSGAFICGGAALFGRDGIVFQAARVCRGGRDTAMTETAFAHQFESPVFERRRAALERFCPGGNSSWRKKNGKKILVRGGNVSAGYWERGVDCALRMRRKWLKNRRPWEKSTPRGICDSVDGRKNVIVTSARTEYFS